jgi:hypothetical protein
MWIQCSVFKPGLVVDSAQILNFDRVTRVNFNFFINQNNIVLVKKKSTGFDLVLPDHRVSQVLNFPCFFTNLARFQSRVDPPD